MYSSESEDYCISTASSMISISSHQLVISHTGGAAMASDWL